MSNKFFSISGNVGNSANAYNRTYKSRVFAFTNSATITTGSYKLFDFHEDDSSTRKYGAFNNTRIVNNSSNDITIYPNQDKNQGILIPANTVQNVDSRAVPFISSLLILNSGSGTIAAGEIKINVWKDLTETEQIASRIHKKFFGGDLNNNFFDKLFSSGKKLRNL